MEEHKVMNQNGSNREISPVRKREKEYNPLVCCQREWRVQQAHSSFGLGVTGCRTHRLSMRGPSNGGKLALRNNFVSSEKQKVTG